MEGVCEELGVYFRFDTSMQSFIPPLTSHLCRSIDYSIELTSCLVTGRQLRARLAKCHMKIHEAVVLVISLAAVMYLSGVAANLRSKGRLPKRRMGPGADEHAPLLHSLTSAKRLDLARRRTEIARGLEATDAMLARAGMLLKEAVRVSPAASAAGPVTRS